jgi:hypothetical protein
MKLYYHSVRSVLAFGLALTVFVPTLAGFVAPTRVNAQATSSTKGSTSTNQLSSGKIAGNIDGYIIEEINGVAVCRRAKPEEIPSLVPKTDLKPVPVDQVVSSRGVNAANGLTITLTPLTQLNNDANKSTVLAALQRAAAVWETKIKTPLTIELRVDYGPNLPGGGAFGANVLGSTGSRRTMIDYPGLRTNLLAGSSGDAETGIYNQLPPTTLPTDTGDTQGIEVNRSVAFALGIPVVNPADPIVATMAFNKNFPYDFNPDNGITFNQTDFVAVATHEIGHALGFTSGADSEFSTQIPSIWDLFRFRPGMSAALLPTAQRVMTEGGNQNYFSSESFVVNGLPTNELELSTGGPDGEDGDGAQSSHWKEDALIGKFIGIMDPSIAKGVHEEANDNDFKAIELFGWNLISSASPPAAPPLPPAPANDNFANAQVLNGCSGFVNGVNVGATREGSEPNHAPDNGGGNRSVWFRWQAPSTGTVTFRTAGSRFDTVLGVYTGSSLGGLVLAAPRHDDNSSTDKTSTVSFTANAGTLYRIAVDGYDNESFGDFGPLKLNWDQTNCSVGPQLQLLLEESGPAADQATAFDSIFHVRDPFAVISTSNLLLPAADKNTRVVIFVAGLPSVPASSVVVNLIDANIQSFDVTPQDVHENTELQFSQITFRLPSGLAVGTCKVKVISGSSFSNTATIRIGP